MNAAALDQEDFLTQISRPLSDGRREAVLHLENLRCGACVKRVKQALNQGDVDIEPDVPSASALLRWSPEQSKLSQILAKLEDLGFPASTQHDDGRYQAALKRHRQALMRVGLALLLGMQVMMLASGEYLGEIDQAFEPLLRGAQWLLATPVMFYSGWPFLTQGLRSLLAARPTMDTPVALAMVTAYGLSAWHTLSGQGHVYFDSVAMFVLLLSLARMAQDRGQLKAADRLRRLIASQPATAQRLNQGLLETVPTTQLQPQDVVEIAPGATVPADGELFSAAELDESLLSGESLPLSKGPGDQVLAGSINRGLQSLRMRVTQIGQATQLSQIAQLVQRAAGDKSGHQDGSENIARYFVLLVLFLAGLTAWYWRADPEQAMQALLAVLVVTCPCALSLAVPTSLAAAVTQLGKRGILLVRPTKLNKLPQLKHVCLDKTGTLTEGRLQIAEIQPLYDAHAEQCRNIAAQLEAGLAHPIARAFHEDKAIAIPDWREVRAGRGVVATIQGEHYSLMACDAPAAQAHPALRWFELCQQDRRLAYFALSEVVRPSTQTMLDELRRRSLSLHLLSGDQSLATHQMAHTLNMDHVGGGQSPADKLAYIHKLQLKNEAVMAVGDGINDGPVLAGADFSIGLTGGSALAQSAGDALLLNDDLAGIADLLDVANRAQRIIRQNFSWAIGYNLTMVPIAMMGLLTPWVAALGMGASSLLVTLNALRLLRPVNANHADAPHALQEQLA